MGLLEYLLRLALVLHLAREDLKSTDRPVRNQPHYRERLIVVHSSPRKEAALLLEYSGEVLERLIRSSLAERARNRDPLAVVSRKELVLLHHLDQERCRSPRAS